MSQKPFASEPDRHGQEGCLARENGGRVLWSFTDQALPSLTNAALTIVVARTLGRGQTRR